MRIGGYPSCLLVFYRTLELTRSWPHGSAEVDGVSEFEELTARSCNFVTVDTHVSCPPSRFP